MVASFHTCTIGSIHIARTTCKIFVLYLLLTNFLFNDFFDLNTAPSTKVLFMKGSKLKSKTKLRKWNGIHFRSTSTVSSRDAEHWHFVGLRVLVLHTSSQNLVPAYVFSWNYFSCDSNGLCSKVPAVSSSGRVCMITC